MRKVDYTSNKTNYRSDIVSAIKANDNGVLKSLYKANYYKVEGLVLKNNGTKDHAKDIYQDAFLAVWKNVQLDKFTPQNESSLHGYIYTIAKNKWMDYLRSKDYKKTIVSDEINDRNASLEDSETNSDDIIKEQRLTSVMQAFKDLGEPCKSLLRQFYFDKKSMKEIANELQLDAASTRNKKYRCMQKLREIALKIDK
ncbi:RNA polymerase sigma factor [Psychroserpens ponticola]|uniref:Sigma-70 family RNA polymerase sigma factor n=1 Tax=Psychroserpens ponticola TaxID=2932268 RepID=A0ABY7RVD0_9FLAO|nr:sigma-70 family RNA polymerase sigma factor [Psychroserpens ponticola]WCO01075.1 sigma-70 family RNA polymerase sigma factor [Psychroserpens ponticola]